MKKALELATLRRGECAPNPAVGAVVVKENSILSDGYHYASGFPHAEVEALTKLTPDETQGASLYVTLEPCCHWGKTPPCTDLILKYGISHVYYGYVDPNPIVALKGIQQLQMAGVHCEHIVLPELNNFYQSYTWYHQTKKPFVTAKLALSLDGKIAGKNGMRTLISGAEANLFTHQKRKQSDALLTTVKTIIQDDPKLNVRLNEKILAKPIYILDRTLALPQAAKILKTAKAITVFHGANVLEANIKALKDFNITFVAIAEDAKGLNLQDIVTYIGNEGIHDLWVEAGGILFQSLVEKKLLQKAYLYLAPLILGEQAQNAFVNSIDLLEVATQVKWDNLGNDGLCELSF